MCKEATPYTKDGPGIKGGSSWTVEWLKFDNSYFTDVKNPTDPELMVLPTDACLFEDEGFKPFAEKYAEDQAVRTPRLCNTVLGVSTERNSRKKQDASHCNFKSRPFSTTMLRATQNLQTSEPSLCQRMEFEWIRSRAPALDITLHPTISLFSLEKNWWM